MVNRNLSSNAARIHLAGFMGSGKSTMGRILTGRLGRPLADLDQAIETESGKSITETLRPGGKAAFRELEARIAGIHEGQTGRRPWGGTLLDAGTRDLLISAGIVVHLGAGPGTLTARLTGERDERPLPAGDEPIQKRITSFLAVSKGVYSCAHWVLDTDDLTVNQVVQRLYERARSNLDEHDRQG